MIPDFSSQKEKERFFRSLDDEQKSEALNDMIRSSKHIVFLGGAGVSTESGIPDFRSKNGLYHRKGGAFGGHRPEYLLSYDCLAHKPKQFLIISEQIWIVGMFSRTQHTGNWRKWKKSGNWMV